MEPENWIRPWKRNIIFQTIIFRCYVKLREGIQLFLLCLQGTWTSHKTQTLLFEPSSTLVLNRYVPTEFCDSTKARWWQLKYVLNFHPYYWREMIPFDSRIFFKWVGWNHQVVSRVESIPHDESTKAKSTLKRPVLLPRVSSLPTKRDDVVVFVVYRNHENPRFLHFVGL